MSALALIPEADRADGIRRLRADLDTGEWDRRWGHLLALDELTSATECSPLAPNSILPDRISASE